MSEKVCRYCKDEFCVNSDCPMRADYCPVPDMPGVCRYEERVERAPMGHKECLAAAFYDCGQEMRESEVEEIFDSLVKILGENGFAIQPMAQETVENEVAKDNAQPQFYPGQEIHFEDIMASDEWIFQREVRGDDGFPIEMRYITKNGELVVSFDREKMENNDVSIVMLRKQNDEHK